MVKQLMFCIFIAISAMQKRGTLVYLFTSDERSFISLFFFLIGIFLIKLDTTTNRSSSIVVVVVVVAIGD